MRTTLADIIKKDMVLTDLDMLAEKPFEADTKGLMTLILYVGENQRNKTQDSYDRSAESMVFLNYLLHKMQDKNCSDEACTAVKGFISAYKDYNTHPKGAFEDLNIYQDAVMMQMHNVLKHVPDFENMLTECKDDWSKFIYTKTIPATTSQQIHHHFANMVAELTGYMRLSVDYLHH